MLLVAYFNNSYKDYVFFYIFLHCIICVKSRPGITSLGFYYTVEQKYIFVKLIGAWIFLANIPFLLHCLLFLQYKFPHFQTITQTGTLIWVIGSQMYFIVEKWSSFPNFIF